MKIAAIADLHYRPDSAGLLAHLIDGVEREADVLLLPGDLTDTGLPAEMEVLLADLRQVRIPMIAVLGNHDHESDCGKDLAEMLRQSGIKVLDGTVCEMDGVGFVGTKGFCGGFDGTMVQPFGERALKDFIQTSMDEVMRLENALAKLDGQHKVALMHYAPIPDTLAGESPELFAFLGTGRLANAVERRGVDFVVHGHAHHGSPEGRTARGIPVYNVCRFVLARSGERPYRLFEL